jgi:thiamine transport system permease protein
MPIRIKKRKRVFFFFLQLPVFLPTLFVLLTFLELFNPFPVGNVGVSLIHGISLSGLIAIQISSWIEQQAGGLIETALVLGAKRRQILWQCFKMTKWQFLQSAFFVFSIAFTSFSVPMIVGGGHGTNIEILIYEKIRISSDWGSALSMALIQSFLLVLLVQIKPIDTMSSNKFYNIEKIGSNFSVILGVTYILTFVLTLLAGAAKGWTQLQMLDGVWAEAVRLIPISMFLSTSVAMAAIGFLLLIGWAAEVSLFKKFMNGYVAPSTSIIGFSILIFAIYYNEPFLTYSLGFLILSLNSVYRLGMSNQLKLLQPQQEIAKCLGAPNTTR